jgi:hypothetical protein
LEDQFYPTITCVLQILRRLAVRSVAGSCLLARAHALEQCAAQVPYVLHAYTPETLATIALWHSYAGQYRGFWLYTRKSGATALIDSTNGEYVRLAPRGSLLLIESQDAARHFIDSVRAFSADPGG